MSKPYVLSCCSTADMTEEQLKALDVNYICFHYELDGVSYPDDLGKTMKFEDFYKAMADGADTRTSQINPEEFTSYFRTFLEEGRDILHLTLSSGISGVYNSARIAAEELQEEYPDRKIYIVDSLAASSGYGLLMDKLAKLRDEGTDIDALRQWALKNRLRVRHWFFSTDLTFYVKGGRVSKTSGFVGNLLNICPILDVNFEGRLIPRFKIRTKKKAIQKTVELMAAQAEGRESYCEKIFISNSACYDDARALADILEQNYPGMNGRVVINSIGTTIGAHTGPGTVALFFWGDERDN